MEKSDLIQAGLADIARRHHIVKAVGLACLLWSDGNGLLAAQASGQVPLVQESGLLLRLAAYDDNLPARCKGPTVRFAIVDDGSPAAAEALKVFKTFEGRTIKGRQLQIVAVPLAGFAAELSKQQPQFAYVPDGLSKRVFKPLVLLAEKQGVPLLAGNGEYAEWGAAVGMTVEDNRPKLVVNLKHYEAQGLKLPKSVLRRTRQIQDKGQAAPADARATP